MRDEFRKRNLMRLAEMDVAPHLSFRVRSESFVLYLSLPCVDASGGRKRPGRPN
jgi:hypothetical protein